MKNVALQWPEEIGLSMAPFGYCCRATRTELTETAVTYICREMEKGKSCTFTSSFDPRDMSPDIAKQLFHWHFNQSH